LFSTMTIERRRRAAVAKGFAFEQFIVQQFATYKAFFKLHEWRGDKYHNGIYALSTKYPDLEYEYSYKDYSRRFAVECKYRSRFHHNLVNVLTDSNLESYIEFQMTMPVYALRMIFVFIHNFQRLRQKRNACRGFCFHSFGMNPVLSIVIDYNIN
jgi:hypothetical protein